MKRRNRLTLGVAALLLVVGCARQHPTGESNPGGGKSSAGQRINIDDLVVHGKTTVFDFYSKYCGPCMRISPRLEALDKKRDDLVVVKVDINRPGVVGIDWQSPVAEQFRLKTIPHFRIYSPDGKLQLEGDPAYEKINEWLKKSGL